MSNDLHALRVENELPAKDIVAVVRELYPKFDKPLLSKCEHGDLYGVDLRPDAMSALLEYVGTTPAPDRENRPPNNFKRRGVRCYCRIDETAHAALQRAIKADGYASMQKWFEETVRNYLKGHADPPEAAI